MTYETIFARSFSGHEQKKLGTGALIACFVVAFTLCTVVKPYLSHLPAVNLVQSLAPDFKVLMSTEDISQPQKSYLDVKSVEPIIRNFTNSRSHVYELNGDIRIHCDTSTIVVSSTQPHSVTSWTTKPYARKADRVAMRKVRAFNITLQSPDTAPRCTRSFSLPAIVFSGGGYAGNHFHDFTDILIPLYLTSRQFNRRVLFLVADRNRWWTSKYRPILEKLSKHDVVDVDNVNEVLCFPRMIVGLKAHKELSIDPQQSPHNYSLRDFRSFLRSTYSLDRQFIKDCRPGRTRRPRLLVVSRKKTRRLTNGGEVAALARSLGFDVRLREMGRQVSSVARDVNSFDVMAGVHGAGLTNMVFLPVNAVVIQIVPIGLEMLARHHFERPAEDMEFRYLEYRVSLNESSLPDSEVYRDPAAVSQKGWHGFRSVYLDGQDVKLDLGRFRETLLRALELVCS